MKGVINFLSLEIIHILNLSLNYTIENSHFEAIAEPHVCSSWGLMDNSSPHHHTGQLKQVIFVPSQFIPSGSVPITTPNPYKNQAEPHNGRYTIAG